MLIGDPTQGLLVQLSRSDHPPRDKMMTPTEKNTLRFFSTKKSRWTLDTVSIQAKGAPLDILSSQLTFKKLDDDSLRLYKISSFLGDQYD